MLPHLPPRAAENLELTLRFLLRAHRTGFISPDSIDGLGAELAGTYGYELHDSKQLVILHTAKVAMAMIQEGAWD